MDLSSVYVSVVDMNRALEFYRELFETEPTQEEERFSTFEFDGFDFGLYRPSADGFGDPEFGDNCVPNFEVDDVEAAHERVQEFAPDVDDSILEFGDYRTFHLTDTEGNTIEVFSLSG